MEMVYLVNGGESGGGGSGGGGASAGYPIVKAVVTDGAVGLQDRSVTRVELKTPNPVRINFPPRAEGVARDFLLRLVITADTVPEVTFAVPTGETFSFEEGDEEVFRCLVGVNVFAFTETDDGMFVVNRKHVSIAQEVSFDANGGTVDTPRRDYLLGAKYGLLPVPSRRGYTFVRWETEDGIEVGESDTVKTSVTRLVARWEDYVDIFAPVVCPGGGVLFTTDGNGKWTIDEVDGIACARSGTIGDNQRTSLFAQATGRGRLTFMYRISSEPSWDKLTVYRDGGQSISTSGEIPWREYSMNFDSDGEHVVELRYTKDSSVSKGSDCCWIAEMRWEAS